jgi:hypothetical protein
MKWFSFLIAILFSNLVFSQVTNPYAVVDAKMDKIPDSVTKSTSQIANYIKDNFKTDNDKVRAAFFWTASRISYDIENMYSINFNATKEEKINNTLKSKKGVCINYAEIFNEITNKIGVKSVVIDGYTKQNGKVDLVAHAWCGVLLDDNWFVFDPTWASGYVTPKKQFVKKMNNSYYKADPVKIIASHMPFDYLWQFLGYPVSNDQFLAGQTKIKSSEPPFDYFTEIERYESYSYVNKLKSSAERIELAGIKNALVLDRLKHKKAEIENLNVRQTVDNFNDIVTEFNEAIALYNNFVNYRNTQFKPMFQDSTIKEMIQTPRDRLAKCKDAVYALKNVDKANLSVVNGLKKSTTKALEDAENQLKFVNEYISKSKNDRKAMLGQKTILRL